jgi:hypothetical protein
MNKRKNGKKNRGGVSMCREKWKPIKNKERVYYKTFSHAGLPSI